MSSILEEIESMEIICLPSSANSGSDSELHCHTSIPDIYYPSHNSNISSSNASCLSFDDLLSLSSKELAVSTTSQTPFKISKFCKKTPEQVMEDKRTRNRISAKKCRERRLAEIKYWKSQAHNLSIETALLKEKVAEMEKEKKKWISLI